MICIGGVKTFLLFWEEESGAFIFILVHIRKLVTFFVLLVFEKFFSDAWFSLLLNFLCVFSFSVIVDLVVYCHGMVILVEIRFDIEYW